MSTSTHSPTTSSPFSLFFLSSPSSPTTSSPFMEFINRTLHSNPSLLYPPVFLLFIVLPFSSFMPLTSSQDLPLSLPSFNTPISSFIDSLVVSIPSLPSSSSPFLTMPNSFSPLLSPIGPILVPSFPNSPFISTLPFASTSSTTLPPSSSSSTPSLWPPNFLLPFLSYTNVLPTFVPDTPLSFDLLALPSSISVMPSALVLDSLPFEGSSLLGWVNVTARRAYKN